MISVDLKWCQEHLPERENMRIAPQQNTAGALALMLGSKAFILSNSTFGWWGAWLADFRPVIAPTRFLNERTWDIVPPIWVQIPGNVEGTGEFPGLSSKQTEVSALSAGSFSVEIHR